MKKLCILFILFTMFSTCLFLAGNSSALSVSEENSGNHTWMLRSMSEVPNNSSLIHFVWEICRPPYGPYDTITLHRVVSHSRLVNVKWNNKKVIFMIPGTWNAGGWSQITDPNINTMLFLALNGYDVYTIDFRSCNIQDMDYDQFSTYEINVAPTGDWTYGVFREDIKACVEKAKFESAAQKVFMSGFSRGGTHMYIYASKYQQDLKGLVVFDYLIKDFPPTGTQMDEATYNYVVNLFKTGGFPDPENPNQSLGLLYGVFGLDTLGYNNWKLAGVQPYSKYMVGGTLPSQFNILSDYVADSAFHVWDFMGLGEGALSNYYGGYIDRDVLVQTLNEFSRYYPTIQSLEDMQLQAYTNVPYFDYDDNPINLPAVGFLTSYVGCMMNNCMIDALPNITTNSDVTINLVSGYGHMDILFGKNSLTDVKQPLLTWLDNHANPANDVAFPGDKAGQEEIDSYLENLLKTFFHLK